MKRIIFLLSVLFFACSEKETPTFNDGHEIFFEKFFMNEIYPGTASADSTEVSYFFYPDGTRNIEIPLVVCLSGRLLVSDITFGLKVDTENTSATPEEYTIDPSYSFKSTTVGEDATEIKDTIFVKIHRSARMDDTPIRLVVELEPGTALGVGQYERRKAKIIVSTMAIKPDWWTTEVTNNLLGTYSEKKYKLFLNEIDVNAEMSSRLIQDRPDQAIKLVMRFKAWLNEQNPPITEDDGSLMNVAI